MRLAPLIPLAVLGFGILAAESLRWGDASDGSTSPLLLVREASVTAANDQSTISFVATELAIGVEGAQAAGVEGQVDTQGLRHRFAAANLEQGFGGADMVLDGDVQLWHDKFHIRSNHATISRDGEVNGVLATIVGPQGQSRADTFTMAKDGTAKLEGNVRALISTADDDE